MPANIVRKRKFNKARFIKFLLFTAGIFYVVQTFFSQELAQAENAQRITDINSKITQNETKYQELNDQKSIIGTPEYIEQVARERCGLIYPDEIVFIDPLKH